MSQSPCMSTRSGSALSSPRLASSAAHSAREMSASPSSTPLFVLRGHRAPIHTVTLHDGEIAGVTSQVHAAASSNAVVRAAARPVAAAAPMLLSGDADGNVMVWNLNTRRSVARIAAHTMPVLAVHAFSDGKIAR